MAQSRWTPSKCKESWNGPLLKQSRTYKVSWVSAISTKCSSRTSLTLHTLWTTSLAKINNSFGLQSIMMLFFNLKKFAATIQFIMETDASSYALFMPTNPIKVHKIFLEDNPDLWCDILQTLHDFPAAGHPSISNTWELVHEQYKGPRLWEFIEQYIKGCTQCQESKTNMHWSKAPLQCFDTPVEEGPFQYILMDLITDLPKSQGFDSILMILDQGCSKAAKFIPCMKTIDGTGVALEYLKHLVPWFGLPKWIISDCDPWFTLRLQKTCARH